MVSEGRRLRLAWCEHLGGYGGAFQPPDIIAIGARDLETMSLLVADEAEVPLDRARTAVLQHMLGHECFHASGSKDEDKADQWAASLAARFGWDEELHQKTSAIIARRRASGNGGAVLS